MHRNNFVVTIRNVADNKPLREHKTNSPDTDRRRERKVFIPFNSEYKFSFKNMSSCRRSVNIYIDGDEIGNWVINSHQEADIERFLDMARKFKFVPKESGEVADPSNPENGRIVVTVYDELQPRSPRPLGRHYLSADNPDVQTSGGVLYFSTVDSIVRGTSACLQSNGATVDGGHSNQTFSSTHWRGNSGFPMVFEFIMMGTDPAVTPTRRFCPACGERIGELDAFCSSCGADLGRLLKV